MKKMYDYWGAYDEDALEQKIQEMLNKEIFVQVNRLDTDWGNDTPVTPVDFCRVSDKEYSAILPGSPGQSSGYEIQKKKAATDFPVADRRHALRVHLRRNYFAQI